MENETNRNELNLKESNDYFSNNIFKIDYPGQNLDNNKGYKQWIKSMKAIHGKNAKIIKLKCAEDNLYFCTKYSDCLKEPSFKAKCPICKKYLCIFCLTSKVNEDPWNHCCLKRGINEMYYQGYLYASKFDKLPKDEYFYFIPGINLFFFIARIIEILFIYLGTKESLKNPGKGFISYKDKIEERFPYIIIAIIFICFSSLLCIPFLIYNVLFILLIFCISLPFNFFPIKYLYGTFFNFSYLSSN